jgi:hypothetical protein
MWKRLRNRLPSWAAGRRVVLLGGTAVLVVLAFCWGRWGAVPAANGDPPRQGIQEITPPWARPECANRPVAFIYGNVPITREDLGEYLIARYGPERVDFLVNRTIIDRECRAKGITVTDAEVEAQLIDDLRSYNITKVEDFVRVVLNRFHKTLYEYKEDVIRPKLAMIKLVRPTITISLKDEEDAFEAHYGPKVQCRMIVLPKEMPLHQKQEIWTRVSKSEEEFDKVAKTQFIQPLAATAGDAPPIHRHFGDEQVEREAFSLKPGDVSKLLDMKDGTTVILKCVKLIDEDKSHRLEDERLKLHKECMEVRLLQEIPRYFQKLRAAADPRIFLRRDGSPEEEMRRADALLRAAAASSAAPPPPGGPDPRKILSGQGN